MDYYMINNRRFDGARFTSELAPEVTFHQCPRQADARVPGNWLTITARAFVDALIACADTFAIQHFGTRRLGRSGLSDPNKVWDSIFHADVSRLIRNTENKHSCVFESESAMALLRRSLIGVDREQGENQTGKGENQTGKF